MTDPIERLARSPRPRVLFLSHAFGGGVGRHIEDLARAIAGDAEVLLAQPFLSSFLQLRWLREGEALSVWFRAEEDWEPMVDLLSAIGIDRIQIVSRSAMIRSVFSAPRSMIIVVPLTRLS